MGLSFSGRNGFVNRSHVAAIRFSSEWAARDRFGLEIQSISLARIRHSEDSEQFPSKLLLTLACRAGKLMTADTRSLFGNPLNPQHKLVIELWPQQLLL
jgi:hypothetical protein